MATTHPPYFSGFHPPSTEMAAQLHPEAQPHWWRTAADADTVVICLHGFTGTCHEANPIAKACVEQGMDAVTVLLPGHGYAERPDQRRQFARITADQLLNTARETIATARQRYERVGMFGLSMGGAITLAMAAEDRLDACAVAAAALRLPTEAEVLIPLLSWAGFYLKTALSAPCYQSSYDFYHSYALRALWQVSRLARNRLSEIRCPVLAVHSRQDQTIPPLVMDWIQRDIPQPLLKTAWFDQSGHCMPCDVNGIEVAELTAMFLKQQLSGEGLKSRSSHL